MRILAAALSACRNPTVLALLTGIGLATALIADDPVPGVLATTVLGDSSMTAALVVLVTIRVRTGLPRGLHARTTRTETRVDDINERVCHLEEWKDTEVWLRQHHRKQLAPWTPPALTVIRSGRLYDPDATMGLRRITVPAGERFYGQAAGIG